MIASLHLFLIGIFYAAAAVAPDYNSKIMFYYSSKVDSYLLVQAEKIFDNSNFDKNRPTVFYFHGHNESSDADTVKAIVSAYIKNGGFNILIFDWRELAATFYPKSASNIDDVTKVIEFHERSGAFTRGSNVQMLAMEVAKFIQKIIARGHPISKIHLVGHSLGAQLAGYVGRDIKSLSNNSQILPRITSLDPAGPDFYIISLDTQKITKTDASLVDIIHTDAALYGAPFSTGSVDFWPNSGRRPQPGCPLTGLCSHQRSVYLWAESVANKDKMSFRSINDVNSKIEIQMGLNCPINALPGSYKMDTNSKPPYSRS